MKLKEQIADDLARWGRHCGQLALLESAMKKLGVLDIDAYVHYDCSRYNSSSFEELPPQIVFEPKDLMGLTANFELVNVNPTLRDISLALLPKVGRWDKSFDETTNKLELRALFCGVEVVLRDTPPNTCTVERIEEEIEVPEKVIAAHTEKKVRFVLKGDCDPLMKVPAVETETVEEIR